jgi:hypothetical protein
MAKGLTTGQLARLVGYKNIGKGVNRINEFEESGDLHRDLLVKLVEALEIDQPTLERLLDADYKEWDRWASQPITPRLVLRAMACVYPHLHIPDRINTLDELKRYATAVARKYRKTVALVASRKQTFIFDGQGRIERIIEASPFRSLEPCMRIGGRRVTLRCVEDKIQIEEYCKQ